jgi:hypothetical protein
VWPTTGEAVLALAEAAVPNKPMVAASMLPQAATHVRLRMSVLLEERLICGDARTYLD